MRKPVADLDAALPVLLEADLQRVDLVALLAVGIVHYHHAYLFEFFGVLNVGKWRFGNRLSCVFVERGFVVKTFHVADPAAHEEPDHTFGLGGEVWIAVERGQASCPEAVGAQDRTKGEGPETETRASQEVSAMDVRVDELSEWR